MKVGAASPQVAPAATSSSFSAVSSTVAPPPASDPISVSTRSKALSIELLNVLFKLDVQGGEGNDLISIIARSMAAVKVDGGSGDDTIDVHAWHSTVDGGSGDDSLTVRGLGSASVSGGSGDDRIDVLSFTRATVSAGSGDDFVRFYSRSGDVDGGSGDDRIEYNGSGQARGGSGDDEITAFGSGTIDGGSGDDRISIAMVRNAVAIGGAGDDQIAVSEGTVIFNKGDGNDSVRVTAFQGEKSTIRIHGFSPEDVSLVESDGAVYLKFAGSDDSIKLTGSIGAAVLAFDDGTTVDLGTKYSSAFDALPPPVLRQLPDGMTMP